VNTDKESTLEGPEAGFIQIERFARYKRSSLFGLFDSDKEMKFYNIDTNTQCYKMDYTGNLPMFTLI
jgi:hypothetical protein